MSGHFFSDFFSFLSKIRDKIISCEWEGGGDIRGLGTEEKLGNSHEEQWENEMNKGGAVGWAAGS